MSVIIGVDPHKATHQAVAIDDREDEIDRISIRATCNQTERLSAWAAPFEQRTWAVEGAEGLGYLLSQQLIGLGNGWSTCRPRWLLGSVYWRRAGRTRTTLTTLTR